MSITNALSSGLQAVQNAAVSTKDFVSSHKKEVAVTTCALGTVGLLYAGYTYADDLKTFIQDTATSVYDFAMDKLGYTKEPELMNCADRTWGQWWNSEPCAVASQVAQEAINS